MQEGWGSGGDDVQLGGQWEDEEGDMWDNAASQESASSSSSWGGASKKGLQKVRLAPRDAPQTHTPCVTEPGPAGPRVLWVPPGLRVLGLRP